MTEKAGQTYYVIRPEPPALHFKFKPRNPLLYFLFLVSCNVILPVLLFYPLINFTPLELRDVVGISSSALGLSSCFDAPMRLWKCALTISYPTKHTHRCSDKAPYFLRPTQLDTVVSP